MTVLQKNEGLRVLAGLLLVVMLGWSGALLWQEAGFRQRQRQRVALLAQLTPLEAEAARLERDTGRAAPGGGGGIRSRLTEWSGGQVQFGEPVAVGDTMLQQAEVVFEAVSYGTLLEELRGLSDVPVWLTRIELEATDAARPGGRARLQFSWMEPR